jgi:hypothetical protein
MRHARTSRTGRDDLGVSAVSSWPVARPRWVALAEPLLAAAALAGAACCLAVPYVVTIGLSLWWMRMRSRRACVQAVSGTLSLGMDGRWQWVSRDVNMTGLCPVRAWLGPSWVSLRFVGQDHPDSKETMLQVTLWKSRVPPRAWRRLQVCLAGRIARPGTLAAQVGQ